MRCTEARQVSRSFEFTAGSLALNFVDTVASRGGTPEDLFATPYDLTRWLLLAGFGQTVPIDSGQLETAKDVREAAHGILSAVADGRATPQADIATLNACALHQDLRPQYVGGVVVFVSGHPFEAVLSQIAADALLLLQENNARRLRRCPECAMLFIDQSPPGKRRWCSSSSGCGNRAKVRRHRERKRLEGTK